MSESMYEFVCNRCDTHADDASRHGIELFAEHHYKLVHPLFAGSQALKLFAVTTKRPRRLIGARQVIT